jgi:peptidoglycan/LPS O-acetylase OafA/YrhL
MTSGNPLALKIPKLRINHPVNDAGSTKFAFGLAPPNGFAVESAACLPFLEFGWTGVLAVPVFAALTRRGAWLSSFVLAFGMVGFGSPLVMPMMALGLWTLASRLSGCSSRKPSRWSQRMAYGFYPLHLAVIAFVSTMKM